MFLGALSFMLVRFRANAEGRAFAVLLSAGLGLVVAVWAYAVDDRRE